MERMVRIVCRLQTKSLNVTPHRLAPVEAAATHLYMWQHLVHGLPHCHLEIADDAFSAELLVVCALIQHSFQHSTVVRHAFPTHYDVRQRYLFCAVVDTNKGVNGPELCIWRLNVVCVVVSCTSVKLVKKQIHMMIPKIWHTFMYASSLPHFLTNFQTFPLSESRITCRWLK